MYYHPFFLRGTESKVAKAMWYDMQNAIRLTESMVAKAYDVICAGYNTSHRIHGSQGI